MTSQKKKLTGRNKKSYNHTLRLRENISYRSCRVRIEMPIVDQTTDQSRGGPACFPMSFIGPEVPSQKGPQIPAHLLQQPTLNIYDEDDDDDDNDGPKPAATIGPSIPAEFLKKTPEDDDGPQLPPHLRKEEPGPSSGKRQVGPTFPSYAPTYDPTTYHHHNAEDGDDDDDDDDDEFGPKPLPAGMQHQQADAVKEFIEREEKRRKLAEVCTQDHSFQSSFIPLAGRC
jgi:hypothetical protein